MPTRRRARAKTQRFCGPRCSGKASGESRKKDRTAACEWCGEDYQRERPTVRFCGRSCAQRHRRATDPEYVRNLRAGTQRWLDSPEGKKVLSETLKKTWENPEYRQKVVDRMTHNNPGADPEIKEQIKRTKKARGVTYEHLTGGNGHVSPAEQTLMDALPGWAHNLSVPTRVPRGQGYPAVYKIDVAHPEHMVGVEVDGQSHNSPSARQRDAKKQTFLDGLGWTILRFSNQEVLNDTAACVSVIQSHLPGSTT